jgi:hypothetical protein
MKTYGEWRYSSTILDLSIRSEVSGQIDALAVLPPEKRLRVPVGYKEVGWVPQPV